MSAIPGFGFLFEYNNSKVDCCDETENRKLGTLNVLFQFRYDIVSILYKFWDTVIIPVSFSIYYLSYLEVKQVVVHLQIKKQKL